MRFASARLQGEHPELVVESGLEPRGPLGTVLVSHVITELSPPALAELVGVASRAAAVVWVESGTSLASHALIRIREALRDTLHPVAPCPQGETCGLVGATHERDWCHQFAVPPAEAFTSAHWARVSRELGIDLRSLPVSFLVLDRRRPSPLPAGATRLLGRPRVLKGRASMLGCSAHGVREHRLLKRTAPDLFRAASRGEVPSLGAWRLEGDDVIDVQSVPRR
jgi:ribosomal protein RSM22 (predicted rRNA methylase)